MTTILRSLVCLTAGLLAAGCGGGSSATMRLMDAPPPGVTAVNIWVASMEAHVASESDPTTDSDPTDGRIDDDGQWHSLNVDRSIDLVAHEGESTAEVLGQLPLPAGKITQIRLVIDTGKANTATFNRVVCNLDTTQVAKKGIKINHVFKAFGSHDGGKLDVLVDFQLDKSLTPAGNCFALSPSLHLTKVKIDGVERKE